MGVIASVRFYCGAYKNQNFKCPELTVRTIPIRNSKFLRGDTIRELSCGTHSTQFGESHC